VDSFNGPVGCLVGISKGVIQTMVFSETGIARIIPVDMAVNGLIAISVYNTTDKNRKVFIILILNKLIK
jgi:hypothetical protein